MTKSEIQTTDSGTNDNATTANDTTTANNTSTANNTTTSTANDTTDVSGNPVVDDGSEDETTTTESKKLMDTMFTSQNIMLVIAILGIYFLFSFVLSRQGGEGGGSSIITDILSVVIFVIILSAAYYFMYETGDKERSLSDDFFAYLDNPSSIVVTAVFAAMIFIAGYVIRISSSSGKPALFVMFESIALVLLFTLVLIDSVKFLFGFSLVAVLRNFFNMGKDIVTDEKTQAEKDAKLNGGKVTETSIDEVFNVSNNLYNYEDAKAVCKAYDAKLATYDQVESAYTNGAEWCNYGWSDGQMILFHTQKKTWNKIQEEVGCEDQSDEAIAQRQMCGRPGINGGYIANPYARFGVNCYGKKPRPTDDDLTRMTKIQEQPVPLTKKQQDMDRRVAYWKENADRYLKINAYNVNVWSNVHGNTKTTPAGTTTAGTTTAGTTTAGSTTAGTTTATGTTANTTGTTANTTGTTANTTGTTANTTGTTA